MDDEQPSCTAELRFGPGELSPKRVVLHCEKPLGHDREGEWHECSFRPVVMPKSACLVTVQWIGDDAGGDEEVGAEPDVD